jgi:hypothetical protein
MPGGWGRRDREGQAGCVSLVFWDQGQGAEGRGRGWMCSPHSPFHRPGGQQAIVTQGALCFECHSLKSWLPGGSGKIHF